MISRADIIRNRFDAAEGLLAAAAEARAGPAGRRYFAQRMHVLYWGLHRVDEAHDFLERAERGRRPEWSGALIRGDWFFSGLVDGAQTWRFRAPAGSGEPSIRAQHARRNRQMDWAVCFT